MVDHSKKRYIIMEAVLISAIVIAATLMLSNLYVQKSKQHDSITIAVMADDYVQDYNTNYYKEWLEKKSGYEIKFEFIQPGYEKEYISSMITSDNSNIDAVFLKKRNTQTTDVDFQSYIQAGLIMDLSPFIKNDSNFAEVLKDYKIRDNTAQEYEGIYYFPNVDTSRKKQNLQIFWINKKWLKTLGMHVPRNVDELYEVLKAFRDKDPNQNGRKDELPLVSCEDDYQLQSYQYILNAFIYNDPLHMRFYKDNYGSIQFAPKKDAFREGLQYCARLYNENLLDKISFLYNRKQLMELINDPADMVGSFACQSMEDLIYANCEDVIARFIYVPPLEKDGETGNAIRMEYEANIGGFIPVNSKQPEKAYEIMDLMLSDEASLISEYGEETVDWKLSADGDLSAFGNKAKITTINYLKDKVQNKNFAGAGPQVVKESYIDGVTWDGDNSFIEYLGARAIRAYEPFYRSETVLNDEISVQVKKDKFNQLRIYMDDMIHRFIIGELDINADTVWSNYLKGYEEFFGE